MSLTVHINSLPDLVLRRIFSKLPLQDLLYAGRVCPLWKYYQLETGKQVRSLTLLIGPTDTHSFITNSCFTLKYRDLLLNEDGTRMYSSQYLDKRFHLTFGSFPVDCAAELFNIFPHITTLEIAIHVKLIIFVILNRVVALLAKWSPVLKSLKMYLQFENDWNEYWLIYCSKVHDAFAHLLKALNSLPLLEHLTLECPFSLSLFVKEQWSARRHFGVSSLIDLPILGQLREFYFKSQNDPIDIIENSLKYFAVHNKNLKQIGLHSLLTFDELRRLHPQLANRIARIDSPNSVHLSPRVMNIMPHFSSITYLHINENGHLFNGDLNCISSLPQLTHLHLNTYSNIFQTQSRLSRDQLHPLVSIQVLFISTRFQSTSNFESNLWAHLFPNLQIIELLLNLRNFNANLTQREHLSKQQLCQSLSTFVQCPKLHHLFTDEVYLYPDVDGQTLKFNEWIVLQVANRKIIINVKK